MAAIRSTQKKFSEELKKLVWHHTQEEGRNWSKPEFGSALGRYGGINDIPVEVVNLFDHARRIVGCG